MNSRIESASMRWVRRFTERSRGDVVERMLRNAATFPPTGLEPGEREPVATDEDRAVLDHCMAELSSLARERAALIRLHAEGLDVVGQLSGRAVADHPLADDACRRLRELTLHAHRMSELRAAPVAGRPGSIDDELGIAAQQVRDADRYARSVLTGLACSIGVVGLLLTQHYAFAALLFSARMVVDALILVVTGEPTDLLPMPADNRSLSLRTRFVGDAVSHFGEVAIWIALTFVLADHGDQRLALVAAAAVALTLFAAVVRTGASEAGLPALHRCRYRIIRRVGVGTGLVVLAMGYVVPGTMVALGVAAACGLLRTALVLRQVWRLQTTDVGLVVRGADRDGTLQTSFVHGPPPRSRR